MRGVYAGLLAALFVIAGCSTPKTMVATGGSRADGTVTLSYEHGLFQRPVVDMQQAAVTATEKCRVWGYTDAEAFGGGISHCASYTPDGCVRWLVTATYQCTGAGPPH